MEVVEFELDVEETAIFNLPNFHNPCKGLARTMPDKNQPKPADLPGRYLVSGSPVRSSGALPMVIDGLTHQYPD